MNKKLSWWQRVFLAMAGQYVPEKTPEPPRWLVLELPGTACYIPLVGELEIIRPNSNRPTGLMVAAIVTDEEKRLIQAGKKFELNAGDINRRSDWSYKIVDKHP